MSGRGAVVVVAVLLAAGLAVAQPQRPRDPEAEPFPVEVDHAEPAAHELPAEPRPAASALAEAPARAAGAPGPIVTIETPIPTQWARSRGRDCHRYLRRRVCEGPRRVPEPHGEAAELARTLGIHGPSAGQRMLTGGPPPEWIAAARAGAATHPPDLLWPLAEGRLWRGFGRVRGLRTGRRHNHDGVDIGAPPGMPIRAVNDGLVVYSDNRISGYGNLITLVHPDGSVTMYAHNRANYVFAGQRVRRGQIIGEVGETGLARGPHLHFEYRVGGTPRDPIPLFVGQPAPAATAAPVAANP